MPKVSLTDAQQEKRDEIAFTNGIQGAVIGLGLGVLATVVTFRRSPDFKALSRPMQAVLPTSATLAGYLFGSERAATQYENETLGYMDEQMYIELQRNEPLIPKRTFSEKAMHYLNDNRWSVIGISWAASMAGAFGYSFSNRFLTTQQKVVQARMYAQAVTLAVLMASAGLSIYMGDDKKDKDVPDAQLRAVLDLPTEQDKIVRQHQ
ncbi:hypothetical protein BDA99DRAFT_515401 [Phascolomyces articulosus]|uniref:HIG1 domain-containing protein n=1 Tax=Phascolomyces articulosus TaxID=60185 RepID=A0AAD5PCK4_9FUNG|nr:hypothetical protein BDA99DRAFT_515401 [Phascolomyces articulosus]